MPPLHMMQILPSVIRQKRTVGCSDEPQDEEKHNKHVSTVPKNTICPSKSYNFMPNIFATLMLCLMLRSSMISSLPPGMA